MGCQIDGIINDKTSKVKDIVTILNLNLFLNDNFQWMYYLKI